MKASTREDRKEEQYEQVRLVVGCRWTDWLNWRAIPLRKWLPTRTEKIGCGLGWQEHVIYLPGRREDEAWRKAQDAGLLHKQAFVKGRRCSKSSDQLCVGRSQLALLDPLSAARQGQQPCLQAPQLKLPANGASSFGALQPDQH